MATATEEARKRAEASRDLAAESAERARTALQAALRDGALATVGAGDQLVRQLRVLSERVRELDLRSEESRKEIEERLAHVRANASAEFEQLVARGREVVDGLSQSQAAERAAGQARVATSQVKAAATSVRRIADVGAGQIARTAAGAREGAVQTAEQADRAAARTEAAATSVRKAAEETAGATAEAAERLGTEKTEVPLEELKFVELRELAKQRGIEGRTSMNKAELIRALREA